MQQLSVSLTGLAFNAALTVFACFLLQLSQSKQQYTRLELESLNELAKKLRLAIDVIERVGNDAVQAQKAAKVLAKLVAITNTIYGPSVNITSTGNDNSMQISQEPAISGQAQTQQPLPRDSAQQHYQQNSYGTIPPNGTSGLQSLGFDQYSSDIFNAFEDLPADWTTVDMDFLTREDNMVGMNLSNTFTM